MSITFVLPVDGGVVVVRLPLLPRLRDCVPLARAADEVQPGEVGAALLGVNVGLTLRQPWFSCAGGPLVVPHTLPRLQR